MPQPNTAKYYSYKAAWDRINRAQEEGFPFEVVTLCESIISDRLLSFVLGVAPHYKINTRTSFDSLIKLWKRHSASVPLDKDGIDLISAVDEWRKQRNSVVHSMAKSLPRQPTEEVHSFIWRAEKASLEGIRLARKVQAWHRAQLPKKQKL